MSFSKSKIITALDMNYQFLIGVFGINTHRGGAKATESERREADLLF